MSYTSRHLKKAITINVILMFLSLIVLVPLWMIVINSFKDPGAAGSLNLHFPSAWQFQNYYYVFIEGKLLRAFLNSCFITFSSVFIVLSTGSLASFIISRRKSILTNILFIFFLFGLVAPPQIVPTVKVLQTIGIHGTYAGIILFYSGVFLPFAVLLMTGFIRSVPREIDESAIVDGCKTYYMFIKIIVPLLKPIFATTLVLIFMFVWNDFNYPLYLLRNSRMWTMPMSVFNFTSAYGNLWNYVFADLIMASMPIIIVYFFAQNFIISGLTSGAIKG